MDKDSLHYEQKIDKFRMDRIRAELSELDRELVKANGIELKPSQCFHFETDPFHVLFNTNCPDELKRKVQYIISRHLPDV